MSKKLIRSLNVEAKVLNKEQGLVEYVASDESLDSHREIVKVSGWRFNRFAKNAPFIDSHYYVGIGSVLGRVVSARVEGSQLIETVQWAVDVEGADYAKLGFALTEAGYLKAVSVGFIPIKFKAHYHDDFAQAVVEQGLSNEEAALVRRIYLEQEQTELSAVVIGSNANAVMRAFEDGAIEEEQIAACGFGGDEEFSILQKSAVALDSPECDDAMRAMLSYGLSRVSASSTKSLDSSAGRRSGAEESKHCEKYEREQAEFLSQLNQLTQ